MEALNPSDLRRIYRIDWFDHLEELVSDLASDQGPISFVVVAAVVDILLALGIVQAWAVGQRPSVVALVGILAFAVGHSCSSAVDFPAVEAYEVRCLRS